MAQAYTPGLTGHRKATIRKTRRLPLTAPSWSRSVTA